MNLFKFAEEYYWKKKLSQLLLSAGKSIHRNTSTRRFIMHKISPATRWGAPEVMVDGWCPGRYNWIYRKKTIIIIMEFSSRSSFAPKIKARKVLVCLSLYHWVEIDWCQPTSPPPQKKGPQSRVFFGHTARTQNGDPTWGRVWWL